MREKKFIFDKSINPFNLKMLYEEEQIAKKKRRINKGRKKKKIT